jgi:hypothetical protein
VGQHPPASFGPDDATLVSDQPGEFTKLFQPPTAGGKPESDASAPTEPEPTPGVGPDGARTPDAPAASGAGEFTNLFGPMRAPSEEAAQAPEADDATRKQAGPRPPGEKLGQFQRISRVEKGSTPPSPRRPDQEARGEGGGGPPPRRPDQEARGEGGGGPRIVWKESKPEEVEPPRKPRVRWKPPGGAEGVDEADRPPPPPPPAQRREEAPSPPTPPVAPPQQGRGEFTELFGPPAGAGEASVDSQPPQPPPAPARPSNGYLEALGRLDTPSVPEPEGVAPPGPIDEPLPLGEPAKPAPPFGASGRGTSFTEIVSGRPQGGLAGQTPGSEPPRGAVPPPSAPPPSAVPPPGAPPPSAVPPPPHAAPVPGAFPAPPGAAPAPAPAPLGAAQEPGPSQGPPWALVISLAVIGLLAVVLILVFALK